MATPRLISRAANQVLPAAAGAAPRGAKRVPAARNMCPRWSLGKRRWLGAQTAVQCRQRRMGSSGYVLHLQGLNQGTVVPDRKLDDGMVTTRSRKAQAPEQAQEPAAEEQEPAKAAIQKRQEPEGGQPGTAEPAAKRRRGASGGGGDEEVEEAAAGEAASPEAAGPEAAVEAPEEPADATEEQHGAREQWAG